jgi:hypothetical protein
LEKLFDHNDVAIKPTLQPRDGDIEEINLNTAENPKMIKISKSLPSEYKERYIDLFK